MPHYRKAGKLPPKRHIQFSNQPGYKNEGIYYEEVVTLNGFSRAYSIVYHLRPPTRCAKVEPAGEMRVETVDQPTLRHHHLKTANMKPAGDPISGRVPMFTNADVTIARCRPATPQTELYRNADADEVIFVHQGKGTLHTMFGPLPFKPTITSSFPAARLIASSSTPAHSPICSSSKRRATSRFRRTT